MEQHALVDTIPLVSTMCRATHEHYRRAGLTHVPVPQIVGITGACENVDTLFKVGSRVPVPLFFSQTGQLTLEQALQHFPGVYTVMVSGRDEELEDERHLRQFLLTEEEFDWSLAGGGKPYDEEEMYEHLLRRIESAVKAMAGEIVREHSGLLELRFGRDAQALKESLKLPFLRISYDDAVEMLQRDGFPETKWGDDLGSRQEAAVVAAMNEEPLFSRPVFIMRYPKDIKFFNMKVSTADPRVVLSADLVFPGAGEGVGSAVREHDGDKLESRLLGSTMYRLHLERGGTLNEFRWYLDMVNSGRTRPHAGYGIGNDRVIQWLTGCRDIRNCSLFSLMAEQSRDWVPQLTTV
jgi:asparaginyl-tRNA synthetase